ncbi:hypothetical protein [Bacteroides caecimuris]|uniref:hypothetical protein n=1 Tax=Bacteroides caecimuris TaxID=1796613 RepID=UPI002657D031|nr:hypothetical protein [Bacteroides caecimuris]
MVKEKAGYEEIGTGIFVPEEDAFEYALEMISINENLKQEFLEWFYSGGIPEKNAFEYALERVSLDEEEKKEFLEWFYSGNFIKEG